MNIIVKSIREVPEKIDDILALHKENVKTLGFLPEQVFFESAENNNILIAFSENKTYGYLLFNINKRGNFIYITHLCVAKNSRKKGIAKMLFQMLMAKYRLKYRGVRVTCREDYEATNVWEKLGFTFVHEKRGRSKNGSVLFIWWFDFNHPDLFSELNDNIKLKVVLDSNVVYDLMEPENLKTQNSFALLSDWLTEDVEYYITNQLKNDISHNACPKVREKSIQFVSQFNLLSSHYNNYFQIEEEVKTIYNKPILNSREESDIRHITHTINSDANYFITKDQGIIEHAEVFVNKYSLLVMKPEEFVIQFYSLLNDSDYSPSRLSGSNIQKKRTTINELREIPNIFFREQVEKKKQFENKLNLSLTKINSTPFVVKNKSEKIAFYVIHENENSLNICFLRYIPKLQGRTVVSQLIQDFIHLARQKNKRILIIEENYISEELQSILTHFSFIQLQNTYFRIVGSSIISFQDIKEYLNKNISNIPLLNKYLEVLTPLLSNKKNSFKIEQHLFPLKVRDSEIPCFIIPIKPTWAMHLFNAKISEQDLFGGDTHLLFNLENVYYRSAKQKILSNNSRILWYISQDLNKFCDTMIISTASYLFDIDIEKPKILFAKNKRLGVYEWNDIISTANGNKDNLIMAFNFGLNENFNTPVDREQLNPIYKKYFKKTFFAPQSPLKISEDMFLEIYSLGMKVLL